MTARNPYIDGKRIVLNTCEGQVEVSFDFYTHELFTISVKNENGVEVNFFDVKNSMEKA